MIPDMEGAFANPKSVAEAIKKSKGQNVPLKSKTDPAKLERIRNRLKANHQPTAAKCATIQ